MSITAAYMKAQVPAFAALSDDQLERVIAEAEEELNADVWGTRLDSGTFYLAAHKATVSFLRGGSGGAVQSETVGQVSRSYGTTQNPSAYASTSFGAEYERLVGTLIDARLPIIMGFSL